MHNAVYVLGLRIGSHRLRWKEDQDKRRLSAVILMITVSRFSNSIWSEFSCSETLHPKRGPPTSKSGKCYIILILGDLYSHHESTNPMLIRGVKVCLKSLVRAVQPTIVNITKSKMQKSCTPITKLVILSHCWKMRVNAEVFCSGMSFQGTDITTNATDFAHGIDSM